MKVSRPTWFPKGSAGGGVTNRRREGPSSSGFSRGGYKATLMAGHRKMEESKQVRDDPSTSEAPIMHEGRALKPVWTPVAIFGSLGVCIYVPASRHWLISYSPIHLN